MHIALHILAHCFHIVFTWHCTLLSHFTLHFTLLAHCFHIVFTLLALHHNAAMLTSCELAVIVMRPVQ